MSETSFERDLVKAAFDLAGQQGWRLVSVAAAARHGGLDLAEARRRFTGTVSILARFGRLADAHALDGAMTEGVVRDRLFDIMMRRIDFLQQHRDGVIALLRHAPFDPALTLWLARANLAAMGWMLEGAGISARGLRGEIRKKGLLAVWAWTLRAWLRDESADLAATMAALDKALTRADRAAAQCAHGRAATPAPAADAEPDASFQPDSENPDRPG
ncbi:TetR family transcriptional regulator [Acidiphilium sp. AL]|uniref:TetR family transcriptional regulator n=1 Tax=Acidiphilium iwatense TaxID=768198 RepID=A0ABS9DXS9_9PROT|nr:MULTISPECIES: TetR family transcriptional regulator [Acidiphilium]MCF3946242.1 TetR family transcriptional regulator [Acidiphilium iwatense]MCU4158814.1 TetR family transcriptional regulator [Acidiphilium sp. AL]